MTKPIQVAVNGILGKMGREVVSAVCQQPDMTIIGGADIKATQKNLDLPFSRGQSPVFRDITALFNTHQPQVLVDFTIAESALTTARIAAKNKVNLVIGTSGLSQDNVSEIGNLVRSNRVGAVVAPNFALGAVLMMHLAKIAAKYFDYVEIIEAHNYEKADAPSGTALATAHDMVQSRGKPFSFPTTKKMNLENARGGQVDGVSIHSVRLPGLVANQEVIFGGPGQTLSIKHYTINRECFMPGVLLAIRKVVDQQGLIYGLENLLNLGGV